jgi:hypothetical protein
MALRTDKPRTPSTGRGSTSNACGPEMRRATLRDVAIILGALRAIVVGRVAGFIGYKIGRALPFLTIIKARSDTLRRRFDQ